MLDATDPDLEAIHEKAKQATDLQGLLNVLEDLIDFLLKQEERIDQQINEILRAIEK